jgi:hypothetical protein
MKLYTVAGTSVLNGKRAYRFANSMSRAAVLTRNGHESVQLELLPRPMTKEAAVEYLNLGSAMKQAGFDIVQIPTVKSIKGRKETVLWKSMSKKMRAIKGMETLQYAGE